MRVESWFVLLATPCLAQIPGVPGLGWISTEPSGHYERVAGVAGAAQRIGSVEMPGTKLLAVRPAAAMAAAVTEEGRAALRWLDAAGGEDEPRLLELEGAIDEPRLAAWSPAGDALLLASDTRLQVWRLGASGEPSLLSELPLAAGAAAVSDGGRRLLARIQGALHLVGEDGSMMELSREPAPAFTFLAGSDRYAWIGGRTLHIGGSGIAAASIELEESGEEATLLLASAGPGKLLLAEAGPAGTRLRLWNSDGEAEGEWFCPAEITEVRATGVAGVLHLAARGGGPAWMADLGAVSPSVFFVPPAGKNDPQGGEL